MKVIHLAHNYYVCANMITVTQSKYTKEINILNGGTTFLKVPSKEFVTEGDGAVPWAIAATV